MRQEHVNIAVSAFAALSIGIAVGFFSMDAQRHEEPLPPRPTDPAAAVHECRERCEIAGMEMLDVSFAVDGALSKCRCADILDME